MAGISAPLEQFPCIHSLLDVIEHLAVESHGHKSAEAVERFYFDLYRPEPEAMKQLIANEVEGNEFDDFAALGLT